MDPSIHGAIVEGAIAGTIVFAGIAISESLRRMQLRRESIERATLGLGVEIAVMVVPLTEGSLRPIAEFGPSERAEWQTASTEVNTLLSSIRVNARWPMRRAAEIRRAVEDKQARVAALMLAGARGALPPLNDAQVAEIIGPELSHAVFGDLGMLDERVYRYAAEYGPGEPPPAP